MLQRLQELKKKYPNDREFGGEIRKILNGYVGFETTDEEIRKIAKDEITQYKTKDKNKDKLLKFLIDEVEHFWDFEGIRGNDDFMNLIKEYKGNE